MQQLTGAVEIGIPLLVNVSFNIRGVDKGWRSRYNIDIFLHNGILQLSDYIRSIAATPAKGNPSLKKKADFFTKLYKSLQILNQGGG
ncbi:MAG: hypothetical protein EA414_01950 [Arthrospira sp. PLM2.Bin9]|nr:MAG: hypothetical protein EA414_01950 [Arthrospira sp. PLM2.Bin9]